MKRLLPLLLAVVFALSAHAQTATFNIPTSSGFGCGIHWNNCYRVPVNINGTATTLWFDTEDADFVQFDAVLGTAQGVGDGHTFTGKDFAGRPYTVVIKPLLQTYAGCVSGRYSRCSTYWRWMPGSTIALTY